MLICVCFVDVGGILWLLQVLYLIFVVGGYLCSVVLDYICQYEGMDCGWYVVLLGWFDGEGNGDFLVVLCLVLFMLGWGYLFVGCGLVGDLELVYEYCEICFKFSVMWEVLFVIGGLDEVFLQCGVV